MPLISGATAWLLMIVAVLVVLVLVISSAGLGGVVPTLQTIADVGQIPASAVLQLRVTTDAAGAPHVHLEDVRITSEPPPNLPTQGGAWTVVLQSAAGAEVLRFGVADPRMIEVMRPSGGSTLPRYVRLDDAPWHLVIPLGNASAVPSVRRVEIRSGSGLLFAAEIAAPSANGVLEGFGPVLSQ